MGELLRRIYSSSFFLMLLGQRRRRSFTHSIILQIFIRMIDTRIFICKTAEGV